jgi:hypothetical protein
MKIKKAVNRIFWRFGGNNNKHPFPVNEEDIEAYNSIREYVKQTEQQQFADNQLFAKMFILMYMKILEKDGGNVFENHARRKICQFLKKDLSEIMQLFTDFLNESEQYDFIKGLGIELKHPALTSEEETVTNTKRIKEALKKPENESKFSKKVFEYEMVRDCLISEVNQAIELCR